MQKPIFPIFLILIYILLSYPLQAQTQDTLMFGVEVADWPAPEEYKKRAKRLTDLAWDYKRIDLSLTERFAEWARQIAVHHELISRKAVAEELLARVAMAADKHALADSFYQASLTGFRIQRDSIGMMATLNSMGAFYMLKGDCEKATLYSMEAMRVALARLDSFRYLVIGIGYADALGNCGQCATSLPFLDSLEEVSIRLDQAFYLPHLNVLRSYCLNKAGRFAESLAELETGLTLTIGHEDDRLESDILHQIGIVHLELKEYAIALEYFEESACLDETLVGRTKDIVTVIGLGAAMQGLGMHEEARYYFDHAIAHCEATGKEQISLEAYRAIGLTYGELEDYEKGFRYLKLFEAKYDSLLGVEVQQRIAELDASFERERMAHTLEKTKQEMAAQQNRLVTLLLMVTGGFVIVLCTYLVVFAGMRRRKAEAEKRQIELEYTALRAQMNPHFIFNALNSIQGYFAEQDFAKGNEYMGAFGQLMRAVLEQSGQRYISLQKELETLGLYLQLEQVRLTQGLTYAIHLSEDLDPSMATLPPLIMQPFVENAIWHGIVPKSGAGHIDIFLSGDEDILIATIEDNGIGLTASSKLKRQLRRQHVSRGIQITVERLGPYGKMEMEEIQVESGQILGTRIRLFIPQIDD